MTGIEAMTKTWIWLHIFAMAIATYALRLSFISLFSYFQMPEAIEENLKLVPPAVLAALAVPPFFFREGAYHLSPGNPFLLSGLVASIVAWKTENLVLTVLVGFAVFFGINYISVM